MPRSQQQPSTNVTGLALPPSFLPTKPRKKHTRPRWVANNFERNLILCWMEEGDNGQRVMGGMNRDRYGMPVKQADALRQLAAFVNENTGMHLRKEDVRNYVKKRKEQFYKIYEECRDLVGVDRPASPEIIRSLNERLYGFGRWEKLIMGRREITSGFEQFEEEFNNERTVPPAQTLTAEKSTFDPHQRQQLQQQSFLPVMNAVAKRHVGQSYPHPLGNENGNGTEQEDEFRDDNDDDEDDGDDDSNFEEFSEEEEEERRVTFVEPIGVPLAPTDVATAATASKSSNDDAAKNNFQLQQQQQQQQQQPRWKQYGVSNRHLLLSVRGVGDERHLQSFAASKLPVRLQQQQQQLWLERKAGGNKRRVDLSSGEEGLPADENGVLHPSKKRAYLFPNDPTDEEDDRLKNDKEGENGAEASSRAERMQLKRWEFEASEKQRDREKDAAERQRDRESAAEERQRDRKHQVLLKLIDKGTKLEEIKPLMEALFGRNDHQLSSREVSERPGEEDLPS